LPQFSLPMSSASQRVVDRAMEKDPASTPAEYLAQFRSDIEAFLSPQTIDAAVVPGRFELPRLAGNISYAGFVDPASGSGADSMTLAVAHMEKDVAILDDIREVKPQFSPESTVGAVRAQIEQCITLLHNLAFLSQGFGRVLDAVLETIALPKIIIASAMFYQEDGKQRGIEISQFGWRRGLRIVRQPNCGEASVDIVTHDASAYTNPINLR
jgi:hypothetical protein